MDPIATVAITICVLLVAVCAWWSITVARQTRAVNGPKWAALAPIVNGAATSKGVRGSFQGRVVSSRLYRSGGASIGASLSEETNCEPNKINYELTLDTPARGRDGWTVAFGPDGPRHVAGPSEAWQGVLSASGAPDLAGAGIQTLKFNPRSGQLIAGSSALWGRATMPTQTASASPLTSAPANNQPASKIAEWADMNLGQVPTPQQFACQLELLSRIAQTNEQLSTGR